MKTEEERVSLAVGDGANDVSMIQEAHSTGVADAFRSLVSLDI